MVVMHMATRKRQASRRRAKGSRQFRPAGWWRRIVDEEARSDLSQKEFCERRGISKSTFALWKRKLARPRSSEVERSSPSTAGGRSDPPAAADCQFLPISLISPEIAPRSVSGSIEIVLGEKRRILLPDRFDPEALRIVVEILESIPC